MKKATKIQIEISVTMDLEQIKRLALTTPGSEEEGVQLLVQVIAEAVVDSGPKGAYIKWHPDQFDDASSDLLWEKYGNPFRVLLAMQAFARNQYGVLDQLAEI